MKCDELKWNWVYYPYLDAPNEQEESALKAGYIKVVIKDEADKVIAELEESHKKEVGQLLMEIVKLKEERRWRSVSDELPEVEEDCGEIFLVAVAVETEKNPKGGYVTTAEFCDGEWYNNETGNEIEENIEREDYFYRSKVTHWMLMPKVPNELKEAEE